MHINWRSVTVLTSLSLAICLTASCSSDGGSGDVANGGADGETEVIPTPVHVAFSGGGWRAHTALAGWTMSLLEDGAHTLDQAFANVETLSSNSGGSWYLSMLTYSESFSASIEGQNAFANYVSPQGYLGQQRALFDDFEATPVGTNWCPFEDSEPLFYFYCRLASLAGDGALRWTDIVNNIVFQPFGMDKAFESAPTVLSDPRQNWATDKSLLIAATMLTDQVVLTETDVLLDKLYYDATLSGGGPVQINVTPVTFASVQSDRTQPPVLSAGALGIIYKDADFGEEAPGEFANSALASDTTPVLLAAAASSGAVGALASYSVLRANGYNDLLSWELAYAASDLAVPVNMVSPIETGTPFALTVSALATAKAARLADGGYLDNSAVAQLVRFLQSNDQATDFQIVVFDNAQTLYTPPPGTTAAGTEIGHNIALLFGEGDQNQDCVGSGTDKFCVTVPAQQIFTLDDPQTTTLPTWSWTTPGAAGPTLTYTQYKVATIDNPTFGLMAGSQGVMHVFTCIWPTADTAPTNGASDFDAYEAMLAAIQAGLQASSNEGLDYVRSALAGE